MSKNYANPQIVQRLKVTIERCGTDSWWAARLGVSRKTVLSYRHGISDIPATLLWKVCKVSGVSAEWIMNGDA